MDIKEFYAQFNAKNNADSIDARRVELGQEIASLEERLRAKRCIKDLLGGLTATESQKKEYLEEWRGVYYFVEKISDDNIITSEKPSLHHPCPLCKKEQPVLMEYRHTETWPEEERWEKNAFFICCEKVHSIKHLFRNTEF